MQAQACNTLQGQNCTNYAYTLASGRTIQPCQRYGRGKRRCRVKPNLLAADRAAFAAAQQPPPPQGVLETAQRAAGGVIGGITGALGAAAGAVSDTVLGATDVIGITQDPAAPIADADLLTLSPFQLSQITGMSVGQIRKLKASRFGYKPRRKRRVSRRKRVSKRRKRRVSKRRKPVSKRRRKSKRRSSRRRSSHRRR